MDYPQRSRPSHRCPIGWENHSRIVLVTAVTKHRKPILTRPPIHQLLRASWEAADRWLVGRYVIMPDHIHLFCAPRDTATPLRSWTQYWKSWVSNRWPYPEEQPIWQTDVWDRQLRSSDNYRDRWDYVWRNPVRHGLVSEPGCWPFAGEMNSLRWSGNR